MAETMKPSLMVGVIMQPNPTRNVNVIRHQLSSIAEIAKYLYDETFKDNFEIDLVMLQGITNWFIEMREP